MAFDVFKVALTGVSDFQPRVFIFGIVSAFYDIGILALLIFIKS